jgi:hypothetical protein
MPEPIFMKLGMYIKATKPISIAFQKYLPSVCVTMCISPIGAKQRLTGGNEYT